MNIRDTGPGLAPDDQKKVQQYLSDGDRAFEAADYQTAIDLWSRIFLIDVTNDAASERIERAKAHLRQGMSVTDTCVAVGCTSLGSFSSRFTEIVGETPSQYRTRDHRDLEVVPSCVSKVATRPRRNKLAV